MAATFGSFVIFAWYASDKREDPFMPDGSDDQDSFHRPPRELAQPQRSVGNAHGALDRCLQVTQVACMDGIHKVEPVSRENSGRSGSWVLYSKQAMGQYERLAGGADGPWMRK